MRAFSVSNQILRGTLPQVGVVIFLLAAGCLSRAPGVPGTVPPDGIAVAAAAFRTTVIDSTVQGHEPSLAIGPDGAIFVCSLRGLSQGTNLYVSLDNGISFHATGSDPGHGLLPIIRSGTGDMGGGDCDVGTDAAGRAYLADTWSGGVSVDSTTDHGLNWRGIPVSIDATPLDRGWVLGAEKDEVYVTAAQPPPGNEGAGIDTLSAGGIWVARSTDGGLTFPQSVLAASNDHRLGGGSDLARDDKNLYLFYTTKTGPGLMALMIAVSPDRGATWEQRTVAEQRFYPGQCLSPLQVFPVVAADGAGGVYLAWSLQNPETKRIDLFMASSADHGQTWNKPVLVTDRAGTRLYPWIAAQGSGHVGLVWYESNFTLLSRQQNPLFCTYDAPDNATWFLHYAESHDALNAAPHFAETLVQSAPIHNGSLDRPYAEVLQVRFTPGGRAATAYVADVPEGVARPMFAIQTPSP